MRNLGLLVVLGLACVTQGCAIFVRGDLQDVTLQSQVPDVVVAVDGQVAKLGLVELDRARVHVIHAEAPGYDPLEVTVYPALNDDWMFAEQCLMWPILWLPMAIDYNSGSLNDFPEKIDLQLSKTKEAPAAAAGANPPSTVAPVAEVREVKLVVKKPKPQPLSIREARTSRGDLNDGF